MAKITAALVALGLAAAIGAAPALADPPANNGHNCAGFTSSFVPPGLGGEVSALAHAFPEAIPTLLDFANCGGNGFPP
jgi:hypothetical protein